jgi:hypothetical protein
MIAALQRELGAVPQTPVFSAKVLANSFNGPVWSPLSHPSLLPSRPPKFTACEERGCTMSRSRKGGKIFGSSPRAKRIKESNDTMTKENITRAITTTDGRTLIT